MNLSELHTGQTAIITKVSGHGSFRRRVIEMGFVPGRKVKVVLAAPLQDPIKYSLMGYEVSLRRSEAALIKIDNITNLSRDEELIKRLNQISKKDSKTEPPISINPEVPKYSADTNILYTINVALVGNPNCGKTSLFNIAAGAREHVGNYSGVTVDAKSGHFVYRNIRFNIIDLPGTYSLASYSPEERYVRHYLKDGDIDVIINVIDASNLERNLYLTTELIDMDRRMVIALNMYDELESTGTKLNYSLLGDMLGVPIVPTAARNKKGVDRLFDTVISVMEDRNESVRHIHVTLNSDIEYAIKALRHKLSGTSLDNNKESTRFIAIKLLEHDTEIEKELSKIKGGKEILAERDILETRLKQRYRDEELSTVLASERYGFISGALAETFVPGSQEKRKKTSIIDRFVTHKFLGFPFFFLAMFVTFWMTFSLGQYPMNWMQYGIDTLSNFVNGFFPDGILKDLIADGIIGGVGGVIVFLPNILILYFCLSVMEDTGYMSRAAFIMDKIMHTIGLHGKSFIPLIMGFGCNVPAIMASRAIESRSSRLITILINPFMSCSARLPLYVLLIGTFFKAHAAIAFFCIYLCGIILAVLTAKLLRGFVFKKDETPFVMELPPYRVPTIHSLVRRTWGSGIQYLRKMGGLILVASIVVWALNYFPQNSDGNHSEDSYLEMAGKAINPIMEPIGFNWKATVAAMAGVPAKEIVVSTLGVLYSGNEAVNDASLSAQLEETNPVTGEPDFTPLKALSFMVFILLYCPCLATIMTITRESGSIKWGAFSILYNTSIAWLVSWVVYRVGELF